jgi:hypothetical protein
MGIAPEARPAVELHDYLAEERNTSRLDSHGHLADGLWFVVARFKIFGNMPYMPQQLLAGQPPAE